MSTPKPPGPAPARRGSGRRLLLPIAFVLLVGGFYAVQWWRQSAGRAEHRGRVLADSQAELAKETPDLDRLGGLMAELAFLPDASSAPELLAVQAEVALLRGRPERADRLFGAIASSPGAPAEAQQLGARILIDRQSGFGGDAATAQDMLQRVIAFSEAAYASSGDARDLFRAWQACKRLWAHDRAAGFAAQLQSGHADSKEHRLVALSSGFDPASADVAVADLVIDFGEREPAELAAMQTAVLLQSGRLPAALKRAEKDLNRFAGVGGVRYVLAIVLHACALGSGEGSLERARFVQRRDEQLAWLEARAPAGEALRQRWQQMRRAR